MSFQKNLLCFIYLLLSIAGAIFPILSNIEFARQFGPGFNIGLFIELANANPASESLSRDLFIGASSVFIWIFVESRRLRMKHVWLVFLSSFTIAFAFAAPFFLLLRERRLLELEEESKIIK